MIGYLKDFIKKWIFILNNTIIVNPTEIKINVKLLVIYTIIVIIYSYLKNIPLMGIITLIFIGGLCFLFYYYLLLDFKYYSTYYDAEKYIERLSSPGNNKNDDLENFQISYNKFRNLLKKRIRDLNKNLLVVDYKINHILKSIDIFFDTSINILFKKGIMDIQYTPKEEYQKFLTNDDYPFDDVKSGKPPDPYNYDEYWKIKKIDYYAIKRFFESFNKNIIHTPRPRAMNLYVIDELFQRWNDVLKELENDTYQLSENKINDYYEKMDSHYEKRIEQRRRIIELISTNFIGFLLAISIAVLIYILFEGNLF